MRTSLRTVCHGRPALAAALIGIAACAGWPAARAAVPAYEVTVPLKGDTAEQRTAAMAEALRAVAVQASGRRDAGRNATVGGASPSQYVQRYSTTPDRMLKVGFDGRAIEQLLQQAGLPWWPSERPVTVIRAPVPDPAVVVAAARWRGVPIEWATGAATGSRAVLNGVADGNGFTWTFSHGGRKAQARGSVEDGVHLAADTLAAWYAAPATRPSSTVTLRVGGMDDLAAYSGLLAYLSGLSPVRGIEVASLDGTVVTLRLVVRGDREVLERVAALDGRLRPVAAGEAGAPTAVDVVYQP